MADAGAAQLRLLDGGRMVDEDQLYELYAYPAGPNRCVVRGNAIASLDGAATTGGLSGGLGAAGDHRLFAIQRELADVIVVGAGTARTENYGGARMSAARRRRRRARGQPDVPPIALVTRTGLVDPGLRVLTDSEVPALVLTCAASARIAGQRPRPARRVGLPWPARRAVPDLGPVLVGGGAVRIAAGDAEVFTRMRRAHVLADSDGYL